MREEFDKARDEARDKVSGNPHQRLNLPPLQALSGTGLQPRGWSDVTPVFQPRRRTLEKSYVVFTTLVGTYEYS